MLYDFELVSRLGFSVNSSEVASVWHLEVGSAPKYHDLAHFIRPPESVFHAQLAFLRSYADLRLDRAAEIAAQTTSVLPFFASIAFLRGDAKRWTFELLEAVLQLARFVEYRVKHALACRRPHEFSAQVQPIIQTPGHGALPSGHATESFAVAVVLARLLHAAAIPAGPPENPTDPQADPPYKTNGYRWQLVRLATRIAINRTVAGVHFPIDSVAGAVLGITLGQYFLARVVPNGGAACRWAEFDGSAANIGGRDFRVSAVYDFDADRVNFPLETASPKIPPHPSIAPMIPDAEPDANVVPIAPNGSPLLSELWKRALAEWT
jgi:membrane-associated phospholipid phosphatase